MLQIVKNSGYSGFIGVEAQAFTMDPIEAIQASKKLLEIRKQVPTAAGLIVAATVAHAEQIAARLSAFGERPVVVTYNTPGAHQIISNFKTSSDRWIISVGMISEGTDIPRLQVCCHLSRIRTELHVRQVLGGILRRQAREPSNIGGWLYVLAEPSLTEFARRIGDDLPGQHVVSFSPRSSKQSPDEAKGSEMLQQEGQSAAWDLGIDNTGTWDVAPEHNGARETIDLSVSNQYWSEVLSLFGERAT